MAQVFQPGTLLVLKLAFLAALALVGTAAIVWYRHTGDRPVLAEAPVQPIAFSHKHHVGDDGIDCRYCHTTVEKAAFAGIPSSQICMTCHSQLFRDAPMLEPLRASLATGTPLRWKRVYKLPDFVYFDHAIHVRKGVGCIECHGRVDRMPLTARAAPLEMQWCLGCHRNPVPHLRAPEKVFEMRPTSDFGRAPRIALDSERRLTDCSTCHR
jgi:Cytochrome c7 and related cytochrome c